MPAPIVLTASLNPSKTVVVDWGDRDPESLDKVKDVDTSTVDDKSTNEKIPSPWEVTLDGSEDPKGMTTWCKWAILLTVSSGAMCVTCVSSMVGAA